MCNRGTSPLAAGLDVGFFLGNPDDGGALVCSSHTSQDLEPGACEAVSCDWRDVPTNVHMDITVVADYGTARFECVETNNRALIPGAFCPGRPQ